MKSILLVLITLIGLIGCAQTHAFQRISVRVNQIDLNLEFADTSKLRQQGLMHRKQLCGHCGMLFRYDKAKIASMWMKNTYIPLDIAFITANGEVVEIKTLQPHDLTSVKSSRPVLYALEMNQGWFAENNVKAGDKFHFIPTP
ncbi:MAG: DUF192 domain-containing protein [Gammaproteobacteria bacterium]|nr:DUF192 domain-containing protein [Gammaproteobacteria bacterium]